MGNTQVGNTQDKSHVRNNSARWLSFDIAETKSMVIIYEIAPDTGYDYSQSEMDLVNQDKSANCKTQNLDKTDNGSTDHKIVPAINIPRNQSPYDISIIYKAHETGSGSTVSDVRNGTLPVKENSVTDTTNEKVNLLNRIGKCLGFANPFNSCFLNSVLQVIRGCVDFAKEFMLIKIEEKNLISFTFQNLLKSLKSEPNRINEHLSKLQRYFEASNLNGDDVHTVYLNFLSAIHKELKTTNNTKDVSNLTYYEKQKLKNDSIIFKYFYGAMQYKTKCKTCRKEIYLTNQLIKSFPLYVPKYTYEIKLQNCINYEFKRTPVDLDEKPDCNCTTKTPQIESSNTMTYAPEYLLIYLNRGSYYQYGSKNETFIGIKRPIVIKTFNEKLKKPCKVSYKLISVIDHIGSAEGGHYYCKSSYEIDRWWLMNDTQVEKIDKSEAVSKSSNTFIFRKNS